jgi:hypothetical protein
MGVKLNIGGIVLIAIMAIGVLIYWYYQHKKINLLKQKIEQVEISSVVLISTFIKSKDKKEYKIYQGRDITICVYGVLATCTTYDVPASRLFWETEKVYIVTSTGKITIYQGILIEGDF